jgi:hypothetical protein
MNKMCRTLLSRSSLCLLTIILCLSFFINARAQSSEKPLTSPELVRLVYQLPSHPEKKDEVMEEIRRRGIGFALTDGLRSVVATKSGNDALLRRTLEEAERRRLNPVASALPSEREGQDVLAKAKVATLAATEAMPDFIVKQQIVRSFARANTNNWQASDRLTIAVSYRAKIGEEYKVLAVNGLPTGKDGDEGRSYEQVGGTSSTGEYVSMLADLFADETRTEFKTVDTDTLRNRRAIVYEFEVKKPFSHQTIKAKDAGQVEQICTTGYRGRVWIDRETYRVLRMENIATDIPAGFPVTAASSLVDYDWATIAEKQYLLPARAEIILSSGTGQQSFQSRNEIRFRNYQKFGTEVKIIEDIDEKDMKDDGKP